MFIVTSALAVLGIGLLAHLAFSHHHPAPPDDNPYWLDSIEGASPRNQNRR